MVTKLDPRLRKIVKAAQSHHKDNEERVITSVSKTARKHLNKKELPQAASGMRTYGRLAIDRGIRQLLLEGDKATAEAGWIDVEQGAILHWWVYRAGSGSSITDAGNLLGLLLALEEWELADWLVRRLIESPESITQQGWKDKSYQFPRYALQLWAKLRGVAVTVDGAELPTDHVYHRMIEHWDTPTAFSELLNEAAEYHLANTWLDEEGYPEFLAFSAFPISLPATIVVRRALGLETVRIPHPIDALPGSHGIPPRAQRQRCTGFDPLFIQLLQLAQKSGVELPQEHVAFLGAPSSNPK